MRILIWFFGFTRVYSGEDFNKTAILIYLFLNRNPCFKKNQTRVTTNLRSFWRITWKVMQYSIIHCLWKEVGWLSSNTTLFGVGLALPSMIVFLLSVDKRAISWPNQVHLYSSVHAGTRYHSLWLSAAYMSYSVAYYNLIIKFTSML